MRSYWGMIAGVAVGALGGVFAALFGLLLGMLCDLVLVERRVTVATLRFLEGQPAPPWLPRLVVLAGSLYARLSGRHEQPAPQPLGVLVDRCRPYFPDPWSRRPVEKMIIAAATHEWVGSERFAALARTHSTPDELERLFSTVWEAARHDGVSPAGCERMRELARRAGVCERFIRETFVVERLLDPEACRVLGVPRDASPDLVRSAYRRLAAQFHPDTAGSLSDDQREATEQAFKQVQAAYEKVRYP